MDFALGVVLFATGIGVSIALHEAGHMWTAKSFGMKVRRYFIGFGPSIFSFRRGETEYGLKVIPAGGFCDIAGMTGLDPITPDEEPRAFFRHKTWKRVVVLSAGSAMHFIIGVLLVYILAVTSGLPNTPQASVAAVSPCISADETCAPGDPAPAREAALQPGDVILAVEGEAVDVGTLTTAIQESSGPTELLISRNGQQQVVTVDVARVPAAALGVPSQETIGAIGIRVGSVGPTRVQSGPLEAIPATFLFTGDMFQGVWEGLLMFPEKIPAVVEAIMGEPRDMNTPISVVGASIIGGDAAERGLWELFVLLLAVLNFFVGVFNLLPLLPLDGGHIAVNLYERLRDGVRRRLGKTAMPPVDYTKLMPLTYAFVLVLGAVSLLTITADIVNPIRLPEQ